MLAGINFSVSLNGGGDVAFTGYVTNTPVGLGEGFFVQSPSGSITSIARTGDASPDGGTSARVIRLAPGTTVVTHDGIALDLSATTAVGPGIYALQVSAYGIVGAPQLVSILDAAGAG